MQNVFKVSKYIGKLGPLVSQPPPCCCLQSHKKPHLLLQLHRATASPSERCLNWAVMNVCATLSAGCTREAPRESKEATGCGQIQAEKAGSAAVRNCSKLCSDKPAITFDTDAWSLCLMKSEDQTFSLGSGNSKTPLMMPVPDSEKVIHDKREHHTEISRDPGRPGWGPENHAVPPGNGGASCSLCPGRADGEELRSDPGDRAGPGQTHCGPGPQRHRAWHNGDDSDHSDCLSFFSSLHEDIEMLHSDSFLTPDISAFLQSLFSFPEQQDVDTADRYGIKWW